MRRFLLFAYDAYYPSGGWSDFLDSYDTAAEAFAVPVSADFRQVVDTETMDEVEPATLKE